MSDYRLTRGLSLVETMTAVASTAVIFALLIPSLGAVLDVDKVTKSLNNLRVLGTMHVAYANDWDGRQWTVTPDNLSEITGGGYSNDYSGNDQIPPVILGFDCEGDLHDTSRGWAIQQSWWTGNCSIGNFRFWNAKPFNNYANGRAYDSLFWAPRHLDIPRAGHARIREYINQECEWPEEVSDNTHFSILLPAYCMSAAAQVDPGVYRGASEGGSQRANSLPLGHKTPNLASARYPDLKTHMLEHYWLNPPPEDPFIPGTGGVPWYFNMSDRAEPATLFFDGSVRLLPNMEVLISNDIVVREGEDSLWACDSSCFGCGGYFESYAQPPSNFVVKRLVDQVPSHHVFTKDGILGRDKIFNK